MALLSLRDSRGGEIIINQDEISSFHTERGFSYTDYVLILKNGTSYCVDYNSYKKICYLVEEIGLKESPSKTFPRVNEFETGNSYRR